MEGERRYLPAARMQEADMKVCSGKGGLAVLRRGVERRTNAFVADALADDCGGFLGEGVEQGGR